MVLNENELPRRTKLAPSPRKSGSIKTELDNGKPQQVRSRRTSSNNDYENEELHVKLQVHDDLEDTDDEHQRPENDEANQMVADQDQDQDQDNAPLLQSDALQHSATTSAAKRNSGITTNANITQLRGLGFVLLASLSFCIGNVSVKTATRVVPWQLFNLYYVIVTLSMIFALVKYQQIPLQIKEANDRKWMVLRCASGYLVSSLMCFAMSRMVLTECTVLLFTSPVLTFILGALFLGEPFDRGDFLCSLLAYVGVVFVARPPFLFPTEATHDVKAPTTSTAIPVVCTLLAAVCLSIVFVSIRKLQQVHYLVNVLCFQVSCFVCAWINLFIFQIPFHFPNDPAIIGAVLVVSGTNVIGLLCLTKGFQLVHAGLASIMRYFDVVFAFLLDIIVLNEQVSGYSVFGGCVVASSAICVALRRFLRSKRVH